MAVLLTAIRHKAPSLHLVQTSFGGTGLGLSSALVGSPCPLLENSTQGSHGVVMVPVNPPLHLSPSAPVPGLFTFLAESSSLQIICGLEMSAAWPRLEPLSYHWVLGMLVFVLAFAEMATSPRNAKNMNVTFVLLKQTGDNW